MSSLALVEAETPSYLYVAGKKKYMFFFTLIVAVVAFPLCMDMVDDG